VHYVIHHSFNRAKVAGGGVLERFRNRFEAPSDEEAKITAKLLFVENCKQMHKKYYGGSWKQTECSLFRAELSRKARSGEKLTRVPHLW